jgi:hypothetical protein
LATPGSGFQLAGEGPRATAHFHPVAGGTADIIEHRENTLTHRLELLGVGDTIDLEELPRLDQRVLSGLTLIADLAQRTAPVTLHMQDRMRDEMNREP